MGFNPFPPPTVVGNLFYLWCIDSNHFSVKDGQSQIQYVCIISTQPNKLSSLMLFQRAKLIEQYLVVVF